MRFLDHASAMDGSWLGEVLEAYARRCTLAFRGPLRANADDDAIVTRLATGGCKLVDVEVISGSDFIRNEIFDMGLSGEQIEAAFARLAEAGIAARAVFYLGAPYESEASLEESATLLRRIKPAIIDIRPYYPWPGTRAAELSRENGWLHARGEEQYYEDAVGIDMPACRPTAVNAFIKKLRREFPAGISEPWWRRWSHGARSPPEQLFPRRRRGATSL